MNSGTSQEATYMRITSQYVDYLRYLICTCQSTDVLFRPLAQGIQSFETGQLLWHRQFFSGLANRILSMFQFAEICKQNRLFSNLIFNLLKDLLEIYQAYNEHIMELLARFPRLYQQEAQQAFSMHDDFVNLSQVTWSRSQQLVHSFNFPLDLPQFYNPDPQVASNLLGMVRNAVPEFQYTDQIPEPQPETVQAQQQQWQQYQTWQQHK